MAAENRSIGFLDATKSPNLFALPKGQREVSDNIADMEGQNTRTTGSRFEGFSGAADEDEIK